MSKKLEEHISSGDNNKMLHDGISEEQINDFNRRLKEILG